MENNPFNLKIGDTAILDTGYKGFEKEVEIIYMTKHCLFSDVIISGQAEKVQVMTKRLSPKK